MTEETKCYWGRFHKKVKGVWIKQYVGPMTREEMKEDYPDFRHMQSGNPSKHLIMKKFRGKV